MHYFYWLFDTLGRVKTRGAYHERVNTVSSFPGIYTLFISLNDFFQSNTGLFKNVSDYHVPLEA